MLVKYCELKSTEVKLKKEYEEARRQRVVASDALVDVFLDDGLQQVKLTTGETLYLFCNTRVSAKPECDVALNSVLREAGHGGMIKEGVHHKTLECFVRELLASGQELPPRMGELVTVYEARAINVRGAK